MDISRAARAILSTLHLMLNQELEDIRVRIRATRLALGWSLADFEAHSGGTITAVAMGSYERGTRTLSITKLLVICDIFEVSLIHILAPANKLTSAQSSGRHIYDLRALQALPPSAEKSHLLTYIHRIIRDRGDWKGAVISLRTSDVDNLRLIFDASQGVETRSYLEWLEKQGITLNKN